MGRIIDRYTEPMRFALSGQRATSTSECLTSWRGLIEKYSPLLIGDVRNRENGSDYCSRDMRDQLDALLAVLDLCAKNQRQSYRHGKSVFETLCRADQRGDGLRESKTQLFTFRRILSRLFWCEIEHQRRIAGKIAGEIALQLRPSGNGAPYDSTLRAEYRRIREESVRELCERMRKLDWIAPGDILAGYLLGSVTSEGNSSSKIFGTSLDVNRLDLDSFWIETNRSFEWEMPLAIWAPQPISRKRPGRPSERGWTRFRLFDWAGSALIEILSGGAAWAAVTTYVERLVDLLNFSGEALLSHQVVPQKANEAASSLSALIHALSGYARRRGERAQIRTWWDQLSATASSARPIAIDMTEGREFDLRLDEILQVKMRLGEAIENDAHDQTIEKLAEQLRCMQVPERQVQDALVFPIGKQTSRNL